MILRTFHWFRGTWSEIDDSEDVNKIDDDFITENDESADESVFIKNNDNGISLQVNIAFNQVLICI